MKAVLLGILGSAIISLNSLSLEFQMDNPERTVFPNKSYQTQDNLGWINYLIMPNGDSSITLKTSQFEIISKHLIQDGRLDSSQGPELTLNEKNMSKYDINNIKEILDFGEFNEYIYLFGKKDEEINVSVFKRDETDLKLKQIVTLTNIAQEAKEVAITEPLENQFIITYGVDRLNTMSLITETVNDDVNVPIIFNAYESIGYYTKNPSGVGYLLGGYNGEVIYNTGDNLKMNWKNIKERRSVAERILKFVETNTNIYYLNNNNQISSFGKENLKQNGQISGQGWTNFDFPDKNVKDIWASGDHVYYLEDSDIFQLNHPTALVRNVTQNALNTGSAFVGKEIEYYYELEGIQIFSTPVKVPSLAAITEESSVVLKVYQNDDNEVIPDFREAPDIYSIDVDEVYPLTIGEKIQNDGGTFNISEGKEFLLSYFGEIKSEESEKSIEKIDFTDDNDNPSFPAGVSNNTNSVNLPFNKTIFQKYSALHIFGLYKDTNTLSAPVLRHIKLPVEDITPPVITLTGQYLEPIEASNDEYNLNVYVKAVDSVDGVLEPNHVSDPSPFESNKPGEYKITYEAQDNSGNEADPVFLTVIVKDEIGPEITFIDPEQPLQVTIKQGEVYEIPEAKAIDIVDGKVHWDVDGEVNSLVPNTYVLTYSATDKLKNSTTVTITVTVVGNTPPVIKIEDNLVKVTLSDPKQIEFYRLQVATSLKEPAWEDLEWDKNENEVFYTEEIDEDTRFFRLLAIQTSDPETDEEITD